MESVELDDFNSARQVLKKMIKGSSSEEELEAWPPLSPTPKEVVGYRHPELGEPDEDIMLISHTVPNRLNIRMAVYKNKNKDNLIRIINTTPLTYDGNYILINGNPWPWPVLWPNSILGAEPATLLKDGTIVLNVEILKNPNDRSIKLPTDILGNTILNLTFNDPSGSHSPPGPYSFTFNIPESDGIATYVIYQEK